MLNLLSPHTAHRVAISLLKHTFPYPKVSDPTCVFGVQFPNRLGISAGFDKNAVALRGIKALGFGHVEVGTMTLGLQVGNKEKLLERTSEGLISNVGVPNEGVNSIRDNIKRYKPKGLVVGGSIAIGDLSNPEYSLLEIYDAYARIKGVVDYVVFNPLNSSPKNIGSCLSMITQHETPVLVKLSIMEDKIKLQTTLDMVREMGAKGVILGHPLPSEKGDLSGGHLTKISLQQLEWAKDHSTLPVISSGGIMTPENASDRIKAGADLIQVYTGFIEGGITFPYRVSKAIKNQVGG